jgi:hypothetical protein
MLSMPDLMVNAQRIETLTLTVSHLSRRCDMIEQMMSLQQQTNEALLRATARQPPASSAGSASAYPPQQDLPGRGEGAGEVHVVIVDTVAPGGLQPTEHCGGRRAAT